VLGSWCKNIILYCVVEIFSVKRVLTFVSVCVFGGGGFGGILKVTLKSHFSH
jgi:hypothetical protein